MLRLSADTTTHQGADEDWPAFNSLVQRGFIEKRENDTYFPTALGEQALKAAAAPEQLH